MSTFGFEDLRSSIIPRFVSSKAIDTCAKCQSTRVTENTLGEILFFDVCPFQKGNPKTRIHEVQSELVFEQQHYTLKSVIEFVPSANGHFIAHCKRTNGKFYAFNDQNKNVIESPELVFANTLIYVKQ